MGEDSVTIELSRYELREVAGMRWRVRDLRW